MDTVIGSSASLLKDCCSTEYTYSQVCSLCMYRSIIIIMTVIYINFVVTDMIITFVAITKWLTSHDPEDV